MPKQTASQTVGPYFHLSLAAGPYGVPQTCDNVLVRDETAGERLRIQGRVLDGAGEPVKEALVEIWQANVNGRYRHHADQRDEAPLDPHFQGYGRADTDDDGVFWLETIKPGQVPGLGETSQAPHINVAVFASGLETHMFTRLYFDDEKAANEVDPVLSKIDPERRLTLVAARKETPGRPIYQFDIRLQGEAETVFFDA